MQLNDKRISACANTRSLWKPPKAKAVADVAEATSVKAKAGAEATDVEARFWFEKARLEAEEKILVVVGEWVIYFEFTSSNSIFKQYLERQGEGQNKFFNLAAQIGCDGRNIVFVFYENQTRKLMTENPCDERKLEGLRASVAVNLVRW